MALAHGAPQITLGEISLRLAEPLVEVREPTSDELRMIVDELTRRIDLDIVRALYQPRIASLEGLRYDFRWDR